MSLENAFFVHSTISCGRGKGRVNSRGRGISFVRGGRSNSPANTGGRGKIQNNNHPSG